MSNTTKVLIEFPFDHDWSTIFRDLDGQEAGTPAVFANLVAQAVANYLYIDPNTVTGRIVNE